MEENTKEKSKSRAHSQTSMKKLRATVNPFLNFLREFRKVDEFKKGSSKTLFNRAAEKWRTMILDEKQSYIDEAKKAQDFLKKRRAEFKKKDKINKLKLEMKIKKKLKEKLLKVKKLKNKKKAKEPSLQMSVCSRCGHKHSRVDYDKYSGYSGDKYWDGKKRKKSKYSRDKNSSYESQRDDEEWSSESGVSY